jgi:hypothetical protein
MGSVAVPGSFGSFVDRTREPTIASVRSTLSRACKAWDDFEGHLAETYGLKGSFHFMYGARYGWALRFLRGGRLVLAMYPNQDRLTVQIILGPAQVAAATSMGLPPRVLAVLEAAKNYPEGRWLFIPAKSLASARELRPLIALKVSPPRAGRTTGSGKESARSRRASDRPRRPAQGRRPMGIIDQLASSLGEKKQDANVAVAEACLADPSLLPEIVAGLASKGARLAGDCAEVMTKVAETSPELVSPHAALLCELLEHKNVRVRWESAHALALAASLVPELVAERLDMLTAMIQSDKSVIVRDYIVDATAAYGTTSARAARRALPVLRLALGAWDGKHAARALKGLAGLLAAEPALAVQVRRAARPFADHERSGIRKAARSVLQVAESKDR